MSTTTSAGAMGKKHMGRLQKRTNSLRASLATIALMTAACGSGETLADNSGGANETLRVGSIEHLSGEFSVRGTVAMEGVKLAAKEINHAGGFEVDGVTYKIEIVTRDGRTDANAATAAAIELIRDEGLRFIFGPTGVGAVPVAKITQSEGVMNFNATSAVETLLKEDLEAHRLLFKSGPPSDLRDATWARIVLDKSPIKIERAALIFPDTGVTEAFIGSIEEGLNQLGVKTQQIIFPPGTQNFSAFLERARAFNADLLWLGYDPVSAQALTAQAEKLDVGRVLAASSVPLSLPLGDATGSPINKPFVAVYAGAQFEEPTSEGVRKVIENYERFFGKDLRDQTAASDINLYYNAFYTLIDAMQTAGTIEDLDAIADALRKGTFTGMMAGRDIHYDEFQRLINPFDGCLVYKGETTCDTYAP